MSLTPQERAAYHHQEDPRWLTVREQDRRGMARDEVYTGAQGVGRKRFATPTSASSNDQGGGCEEWLEQNYPQVYAKWLQTQQSAQDSEEVEDPDQATKSPINPARKAGGQGEEAFRTAKAGDPKYPESKMTGDTAALVRKLKLNNPRMSDWSARTTAESMIRARPRVFSQSQSRSIAAMTMGYDERHAASFFGRNPDAGRIGDSYHTRAFARGAAIEAHTIPESPRGPYADDLFNERLPEVKRALAGDRKVSTDATRVVRLSFLGDMAKVRDFSNKVGAKIGG